MTQTTECGDARLSLGVYVLGAIDPADRATVDEHLATCQDCRDELAGLAGLPALLSRVDKAEAIAFASDGLPADDPDGEEPLREPAEFVGTVLNLTAARRRRRNWRTIGLSAAAAVIVAAGAYGGAEAAASHIGSGPAAAAVIGLTPGHNPDYGSPIASWKTATGSASGMVATVMYQEMGWGTQLAVKVVGIPVGTPCQLVAIGTNGSRTVAGGWTTDSAEGSVWYSGSSQLPVSQVREYQVTVTGHQSITIPALSPWAIGNRNVGAYAGIAMTSGLIALVVALLAATVAGLVIRQRSGKVHTISRTPGASATPEQAPVPDTLTPAVLGSDLGERATLVQFSTEFCTYCGPTREVLGEIASSADGVRVIEIDAAERMDLTKRLGVFSTPTVLVLGPDGTIAARSSGRPRKAELAQTVEGVLAGNVSP